MDNFIWREYIFLLLLLNSDTVYYRIIFASRIEKYNIRNFYFA